LHRKLAHSHFVSFAPIPPFFEWQKAIKSSVDYSCVQNVHVSYLNFQIYAASERLFHFRLWPKSILSKRLAQHDLGPFPLQESKPAFGSVIKYLKTEKTPIEAETLIKVGAEEFGHQLWSHGVISAHLRHRVTTASGP
jgi:hypothetical protein